jgi:hypothetical protein
MGQTLSEPVVEKVCFNSCSPPPHMLQFLCSPALATAACRLHVGPLLLCRQLILRAVVEIPQ